MLAKWSHLGKKLCSILVYPIHQLFCNSTAGHYTEFSTHKENYSQDVRNEVYFFLGNNYLLHQHGNNNYKIIPKKKLPLGPTNIGTWIEL
jgi:hypothetical protein